MRPFSEHDVRLSFVNCSKGEAKRLNLPKDFAELSWDDLDFLGWRDPGAPERAYLVAERDGRPLGVALRTTPKSFRGFTTRGMCSLCLTTRAGGDVSLMTARRIGEAGRWGAGRAQFPVSGRTPYVLASDHHRSFMAWRRSGYFCETSFASAKSVVSS